jgi:hypothetical protein
MYFQAVIVASDLTRVLWVADFKRNPLRNTSPLFYRQKKQAAWAACFTYCAIKGADPAQQLRGYDAAVVLVDKRTTVVGHHATQIAVHIFLNAEADDRQTKVGNPAASTISRVGFPLLSTLPTSEGKEIRAQPLL